MEIVNNFYLKKKVCTFDSQLYIIENIYQIYGKSAMQTYRQRRANQTRNRMRYR